MSSSLGGGFERVERKSSPSLRAGTIPVHPPAEASAAPAALGGLQCETQTTAALRAAAVRAFRRVQTGSSILVGFIRRIRVAKENSGPDHFWEAFHEAAIGNRIGVSCAGTRRTVSCRRGAAGGGDSCRATVRRQIRSSGEQPIDRYSRRPHRRSRARRE